MRADWERTGSRGPIGMGSLVGVGLSDQRLTGSNGHGNSSLHFGLGKGTSFCRIVEPGCYQLIPMQTGGLTVGCARGIYAAALRSLNWLG